jgi:hypothetical protein
MYSHLTDDELLTRITPAHDPLVVELTNRLRDAVDFIDELEHNLALLAVKYKIAAADLTECELESSQ